MEDTVRNRVEHQVRNQVMIQVSLSVFLSIAVVDIVASPRLGFTAHSPGKTTGNTISRDVVLHTDHYMPAPAQPVQGFNEKADSRSKLHSAQPSVVQ